jgi:cell division protein FtsW (lipid II flippase)
MAATADTRRFFVARPAEFRCLLAALGLFVLFFGIVFTTVHTDPGFTADDLYLAGGFIVTALFAHGLMVMFGSRSDTTLLPIWVVLCGIGLSYQYRLKTFHGPDWNMPACWMFAAAPVILALTTLLFENNRLKWLAKMPGLWIIMAFGVNVAVLSAGVTFRGAVFGPGKTTPTEIIKPLLIIGLAGLLARHGHHITRGTPLFTADSRRTHIIVFGAWLIPAVVLILLGDLGMITATGLLLGIMMTLATRRLLYPLAGAAGVAGLGWMAMRWVGKAQIRFSAWLAPFDYPDTRGFQTMRSLFAVFNGEFFGQGIGNGLPQSIPLVETDFVYAAVAEEFGFIGSIAILWLVFAIIRKSLMIARENNDMFSALVCSGCGAIWLIQILMHVGGVIKLIPMTGVPFPGLSSGGSAVLVFSVLTGWIMAAGSGRRAEGGKGMGMRRQESEVRSQNSGPKM